MTHPLTTHPLMTHPLITRPLINTSSQSSYPFPSSECTRYNGKAYVSCGHCNITSATAFNVTYGCYDIGYLCPSYASRRRLTEEEGSGSASEPGLAPGPGLSEENAEEFWFPMITASRPGLVPGLAPGLATGQGLGQGLGVNRNKAFFRVLKGGGGGGAGHGTKSSGYRWMTPLPVTII